MYQYNKHICEVDKIKIKTLIDALKDSIPLIWNDPFDDDKYKKLIRKD